MSVGVVSVRAVSMGVMSVRVVGDVCEGSEYGGDECVHLLLCYCHLTYLLPYA